MHIAPAIGFKNLFNLYGRNTSTAKYFLNECKTATILEKEKHFPTDVQSEQKLGHTAEFELKAIETVRAQSP